MTDIDNKIFECKRKIKYYKRQTKSPKSKAMMRNLYSKLYELQFQPDYMCLVMDSNKDYDRANKGFKINGIKYRRFLGTNGGIKNSTIVYVNEELYPVLKEKLDCGRDKTKKIVPAKLEAYQALMCSGSTPIPHPNGIIVVDDCITHFKDDVILIDDSNDGEPKLTYEKGYEIERDNSDGYGLMLPAYSRRVNEYLTGNDSIISGMNTRYAWNKGMVYTFDYIDFAEKVSGTYLLKDAWGDTRDVRDAEVILTVSMLKLWDSYKSWEDYYTNCEKYGYQFATPKVTPDELENVRNTNYQFLQSYEFTDEELQELCQPTIDEIKDALGMDYRKSLVFLAGYSVTEKSVWYLDDYIKALMIEPELINDTYIRRKIYSMIKKRIELAKKGSIKVDANFAMIGGDPYALCQSMFGMEVTGLLKANEVYHKYWLDKGADEISCFRAPMTCHNNIRKLKLNKSEECAYWYQYITTASLLNAWDTTCDAMNGCDFDGDTNMCTDNPIILKRTLNSPTIMCLQRNASKVVPTEEDIIAANKLGFNDEIGIVTNYVTSMFEVQSQFEKDSPEYKELEYRIMCGQYFQQAVIDRIKGIIAKPMPDYWYSVRANNAHKENFSSETYELNSKIIASHKPYFMVYVYPTLKTEVNKWVRDCNYDSARKFGKKSSDELNGSSENEKLFLEYRQKGFETGSRPCTVNRICWIFEKEFPDASVSKPTKEFDYEILKCDTDYSEKDFNIIRNLYLEYKSELDAFRQQVRTNGYDKNDDLRYNLDTFKEKFRGKCYAVCPNKQELCNIILDLCYIKECLKQFAWDIVGDVIVENLIEKKGSISFPVRNGTEFEFGGKTFDMVTIECSDKGVVEE